jgi:peptidoglycan/xylan/chitin deacetylase (PgdA/CDA1 family)
VKFITTLEEWDQQIRCGGVPVLMYHKIGKAPAHANMPEFYVTDRGLHKLLGVLKRKRFQTASAEKALQAGGETRFVITFDDGYESALKYAAECIREHGFTAIQFLVANCLGRQNEWDRGVDTAMEPLMDAIQVREWLSCGHKIGAHTSTHPHLAQISLDRAREEISSSKKKLEDLFGVPVTSFAYPYGNYNEAVRGLVEEAGFHTAYTTNSGCVRFGDDPFQLNRLTVRERSFANWTAFKVRRGRSKVLGNPVFKYLRTKVRFR